MVEQVEIKTDETTAEAPEAKPALKEDRPSGLPEKFETVESMAKSYAELETKLGQKPEEAKPEAKGDLEIAEKAVESAGLDMESLNKEYADEGKLGEESYEKLEKAGISKEVVDQFIAGQQAIADKTAGEIRSLVGGDDEYAMLVTWAKDNLSEAEVTAFNTAVNSNDIETVKLAVTGLNSRYQTAEGKEPSLVKGTASATGEAGFQSWAQVTKAMADERYSKDPSYQAEVKTKIANSNL
jgi:hypothetical protein